MSEAELSGAIVKGFDGIKAVGFAMEAPNYRRQHPWFKYQMPYRVEGNQTDFLAFWYDQHSKVEGSRSRLTGYYPLVFSSFRPGRYGTFLLLLESINS